MSTCTCCHSTGYQPVTPISGQTTAQRTEHIKKNWGSAKPLTEEPLELRRMEAAGKSGIADQFLFRADIKDDKDFRRVSGRKATSFINPGIGGNYPYRWENVGSSSRPVRPRTGTNAVFVLEFIRILSFQYGECII